MSEFMFSYGSNLCIPRLQSRIDRLKFVITGRIRGFTYRWHMTSSDGSGKGNAFKTENQHDHVWGSIFQCSDDDLSRLDEIEGVGIGYERREVTVETENGPVTAWTYLALPTAIDENARPYMWYKTIVLLGAQSMGFPAEYLNQLNKIDAISDRDTERRDRNLQPISQLMAPERSAESITFKPIGHIYSPHHTLDGMPIQPAGAKNTVGHIIIRPELVPGLNDLEGFSHAILLYHFHRSTGYNLTVKPFMDDTMRGVFSTRAPRRPNGIGESVVRIMDIDDNRINISDVDILNGTPLLDIKPYVPDFHAEGDIRYGWLESARNRAANTRSDRRFSE